jgi:single-strand DNA-binding protein
LRDALPIEAIPLLFSAIDSRRESKMFQQCIIIDNRGSDPEMRYPSDGRPVTNFSVATNRRWTNSDGSQGEEVTWFRVSCFGKLAETTNQYLEMGRLVMVTGRVKANAYIDRDGVARASLDLVAAEVKFLGNGNSQQEAASVEEAQDIPF